MITLFSASKLSSLPTQAVSTIRFNIFKRLSPAELVFWADADADISETGSIKKIPRSANRYFQYIRRLYWMHKTKPDIILFTGELFEIPFYLLRPRKAKVVLHLNGPLHESPWTYPYRTFAYVLLWHAVAFFVKRAHTVITITKYTARTIEKLRRGQPTHVIYNGVDLETFKPSADKQKHREYLHAAFAIEKEKPLAVYVGSLIARKRPDMVLEIARRSPEFSFVLVGGASPELDLRERARGIQNVEILALMGRTDVARLLAAAAVFCFPALHEGFGMVVAEAMAAGCPPLVSAGSGPAELVTNHKNGIVIPTDGDETAAFASVLKNTALSELHILGENAAKDASVAFGWDMLATQWQNVLREINFS